MSSSPRALSLLLVLALPFAALDASAEPLGFSIAVDGWTGLEGSGAACPGGHACNAALLAAGGTALMTLQSGFAFGAGADAATEIFGSDQATYGLIAGYSTAASPRSQVDLLAELGAHVIEGVGDELFTVVEGNAGATLPFAGARIGWTGRFGGRVRVVVGGWLMGRLDLAHETVSVRRQSSFGEEDDTAWVPSKWTIGGSSVLLCFRVGLEVH